MQETYVENIKTLMQNKNRLEKELKIKITNKGRLVFVSGKGENEYLALKIIEAIDLGFSVERALLLKDENFSLQILNIKDITKKKSLKNIREIRARIIGTHGKTLKTLCSLSNCFIEIYDNQIGIIGNIENIKDVVQCLICLIQGSKQGNVYSKLEKAKKNKRLQDKFSIDLKLN